MLALAAKEERNNALTFLSKQQSEQVHQSVCAGGLVGGRGLVWNLLIRFWLAHFLMQWFCSEEKLANLGDTIWICSVTSPERTARWRNWTWRLFSRLSFPPFKYDTSRKTVRDKCDHSRLCALLQMWWLHTTMQHNGKWHSWVRIISRMNAFFRSHYSDVPTRAQQTHPTTNAGIWRRRGGVPFTELAW